MKRNNADIRLRNLYSCLNSEVCVVRVRSAVRVRNNRNPLKRKPLVDEAASNTVNLAQSLATIYLEEKHHPRWISRASKWNIK